MRVSIVMVRVLAGVVERAGGSSERFLREAQIAPNWIEEGARWLSVDDYFRAVDAAIAVSGDPAFGLHLGEHTRASMFGVIGALNEYAPTLREAIEMSRRYAHLVADGGWEPELRESGRTAVIRFPGVTGKHDGWRMSAEFTLTAVAGMLPLFAGGTAHPTEVRFTHARPSYVAEYQRIFRGTARFDQAYTELLLPRVWLDERQRYGGQAPERSPELFEALQQQAERSAVRLDRDSSIRTQIERLASAQAPQSLTMEGIARTLGMSARSLRRRLAEEGLSFSELVVSYRASAAKRILERPQASIQEAARDLGFTSVSAFHRAFKRWTGMTPKEYQDSF
jgi:AraC-like DNA-binding protein